MAGFAGDGGVDLCVAGVGAKWLKPVGWTLLAWATLRLPNGAEAFVMLVVAYLLLHILIPAVRKWWQLPRRARTTISDQGSAPAVAAWLVGGLILLNLAGTVAFAKDKPGALIKLPDAPLAQAISQQIRRRGKICAGHRENSLGGRQGRYVAAAV